MISKACMVSLEQAMGRDHGSEVDVVAVVAYVSHLEIGINRGPGGSREFCLKDASNRIAFLRVDSSVRDEHRGLYMEADICNHIVVATRIIVNHDTRCLEHSQHTSLTFIDTQGAPWLTPLEPIRLAIRLNPELRDTIKKAVCDRALYLATMDSELQASISP
ncbi:hypothetical protein U9M48_019800 [Paspalum notatum var. saurae]|uniref:Uncharacterized protein n=1 Tax=Paspalum notatum var. saurae TaxID=547442 RepID=A0AAQ3TG89_PASNO